MPGLEASRLSFPSPCPTAAPSPAGAALLLGLQWVPEKPGVRRSTAQHSTARGCAEPSGHSREGRGPAGTPNKDETTRQSPRAGRAPAAGSPHPTLAQAAAAAAALHAGTRAPPGAPDPLAPSLRVLAEGSTPLCPPNRMRSPRALPSPNTTAPSPHCCAPLPRGPRCPTSPPCPRGSTAAPAPRRDTSPSLPGWLGGCCAASAPPAVTRRFHAWGAKGGGGGEIPGVVVGGSPGGWAGCSAAPGGGDPPEPAPAVGQADTHRRTG